MPSFGEKLRRERELRGIDLREIAHATKISVRFLQALEQDRLEVLPGGMFPRAFVRQYALCLGLDAERLVAEFLYTQASEAAEDPRPRPRDARRRSAFLVPALVLAAGVLSLKKTGSTLQSSAEDLPSASPPPATLPADRVYPPPSAPAQTPGAGPSDLAPAAAAEATVPAPRSLEAVTDDRLRLTLSAKQSCWVAAQVDGQQVLNRVLSEGETETVEAEGEIVLSVGNAGGLAFSINDRPGLPLGRSGEVRRNIVITKQSLSSLVEGAPPVRISRSS